MAHRSRDMIPFGRWAAGAQIHGWRGDTDLTKRIEHDLHYIENWSLWLDIKIIFMTIFKGFINKNAY